MTQDQIAESILNMSNEIKSIKETLEAGQVDSEDEIAFYYGRLEFLQEGIEQLRSDLKPV